MTAATVFAARRRISPHLRRTPLVPSLWLSDATRADVRLKLESLQETGSFKSRGALNALMRLVDGARGAGTALPDVVTASAGNHGRAVAWAAGHLGLAATVFTPRDAPRAKTDAIARHGATLEAVADDYEHAERLALAFAREEGAVFVSPYNNADVIAGGGTAGLEVVEDWPEVDAVLVPVGGGGLVSGIAVAAKAVHSGVEIVGVEVEASAAFTAARAAGRVVRIDVRPTIADGLGGNVEVDTITWPFIRDLVDRTIVVSEPDLHAGLRDLLALDRLVAEGAGAVAVAALAASRGAFAGRRVAVLVTGRNIDLPRLLTVAGSPQAAGGA